MTEYGRGQDVPPWHPDDPLFGDPGWEGRRSTYGHEGDTYAGQYADHHPDPYGTGGHQVPQQGYYGQQAQHGQQPHHGQGGYGQGQHGGGQHGGGHYDPGYGHTDPHGMQPVSDPYATGRQPGYYEATGGQPPPHGQQPHTGQFPHPGRQADSGEFHGPPGGAPTGPEVDPETGWDPGPDQGEHAFFADRGDEEDDEPEGRKGRGRKGGGEKKKRSGCACLAVSVVLAGGVGAVGYYGYDFYQTHFAPAPDYSGEGSGQAQVKIPEGASIADMGEALKKAGVTKSAGAFVEAAEADGKAAGIQPGTYSLRKEMSGAAALKLMLDPASQNALIISEGLRAKKIYELVDKKLGEPAGTTQKAAKKGDLGLPEFAENNPEGFLFPSRYSVGEKSDPADVLREMVRRAKSEHTKVNLAAEAKKVGKTPEEILIIASLIQAEAQQDEEFGRVSRVIYNRLEKDILLQFDSTINYAKGRSSLETSVEDTRFDSPYNTYLNRGLPPAPIDNPGHQAIEAALNPTKGDWIYFVTVKPGDTRFTASKAEHDRNVRDFNEVQRKKKENGG
jgi:uncharacterized YceG family protein